jgi:hypothetical protein
MIISLLLNNWKKILFGGIIATGISYYLFLKIDISHLNAKIANLNQSNSQLQDQLNGQKIANKVLQNEMQIRESAIESFNIAINEERINHENIRQKIVETAPQLNSTNRISMLWLRLAFGDMSALPPTTTTTYAESATSGYIIPTSAAIGINRYIESCETIVIQLNKLIDTENALRNNYNKNIGK